MLKRLSISVLAVSALVAPVVSFAQGHELDTAAKIKLAATVGQEERHDNGNHLGQMKKRQDLHVSLTGALTAMNGTNLTLKLANGTSYAVDASVAKFTRRFGAAMVLSDLQLNDQLFVKGTLNETTIKATMIQDLSLQARNGQFTGVVQSVSGSSFVLKTNNRGLQTINTNASTVVMKSGQKVALSDVVAGMTVKVDGVWNRVNDNLLAQKIHLIVKVESIRLNGKVTAVNGTILTVEGTNGKAYTVDMAKANVSGSNYYGDDRSKVRVGDMVQVWGKAETGSLKVNASMVIDFSLSI